MHSDRQFEALEISVEETKRRMDAGDPTILIDVREPEEHALAQLAGAELIPMGTIPQHLAHLEGLSDDQALIVFCHLGVRSLMVVEWLRGHGVDNVQSMQGGIDAWSRVIDPAVTRY